MGKAGKRRQNKIVRYFKVLACRDTGKFLIEWDKRIKSWLYEIHRRGELFKGEEPTEERVFGVVEHAERVLRLCGPEVESLVGASTREVLVHESCKVFSLAVSTELYRIYNRSQYLKH